MIPVKLILSNFTSYGETPQSLDFSRFHLAAISGQNGAGKSSLLDSITWVLWGSSRLGDSSDQLVRSGQTEMYVEFSFSLDDHDYTVKRKRSVKSGGSTNLELFSNTHNLTEGTIKSTQQKIIDTLHLSYETFINSAFIRQGHADEFTTKGATERKKILSDILGLGHYDLLEEKAKEKSKEASTKLQLLDYQTIEIEAELSQKDQREKELSEAENNAKELEAELQAADLEIKVLLSEKESASTKLKNLEETAIRIKAAEQEINELNIQIESKQKAHLEYKTILDKKSEIEEGYKKLENLRDQKKILDEKRGELLKIKDELNAVQKNLTIRDDKRKTEIGKLDVLISSLQTQKQRIQDEIDHLKSHKDSCPTCGQTIAEDKNKQILADDDKKIIELEKQINEHQVTREKYAKIILPEVKEVEEKEKLVKQIEAETKDYSEISLEINKYSVYEAQNNKLNQAQAAVDTAFESITNLEKILKTRRDEIAKDQAKYQESSEAKKLLLELEERLLGKENNRKEISNQVNQINSKVGAAKQLVSRAVQLEDLFNKKTVEKSQLKKDKQIYEDLALAFGKKGIQAMIIENAIPEIEDEANKLLDKLTDGRMKVTFKTQKENKSGTITETLDIIISDELGERPYEGYSVSGDELVYIKENGQIKSIPIQDLWDDTKDKIIDGEYEFQKTFIETLCYENGNIVWKPVDRILKHPTPNHLLEVKCGPGNYTVKLTKNHSIYVLTPNGLQIKKTEDLQKGDFLLSPSQIPSNHIINNIDLTEFIDNKFQTDRMVNNKPLKWNQEYIWSRIDQKLLRHISLNSRFAKLIGFVVAEGSGLTSYTLSVGSNKEFAIEGISLSNEFFGTQRQSLKYVPSHKIRQYAKKQIGLVPHSLNSVYRPDIGGRLVAHILRNMVGHGALLKKIPSFIFNASSDVKIEFLRGLIIGDGHQSINKKESKSQVAITTISRRLAGELIFLCRQLGIWARLENHGNAGFNRGMNHHKSYRVVISGRKNLEILGIGEVVSNYSTSTKYEGIPYSLLNKRTSYNPRSNKRYPRQAENKYYSCGVSRIPKSLKKSYKKIQNHIEDWNILEVNAITEVAPSTPYVYDLMVPGNNSFVAGNGSILVHNSGGEQFRVNFAIRLALSKLLTNRAGSKLQFLVIDEGFGTQDNQGISRIVEAIDTIKDDFAKIVIITHLEELKEEFPARIEVEKGPAGSTFKIVD